MKVEPLGPAGALLIQPPAYGDARGWFMEGWRRDRYAELGIPADMAQMNVSKSARGVVRGLHFQEPDPQGKLVMALAGAVHDVVVDIRVGSPWFGQWWSAELTEENHFQIWCPPGFAHGFEALSESALFAYMVSATFRAEHDRAVRWDDPAIGVRWRTESPQLSAKDLAAPILADAQFLPSYSSK